MTSHPHTPSRVNRMTEAKWFESTALLPLICFYDNLGLLTPRKNRLLSLAFCRRAFQTVPHPTMGPLLDAVERLIDDPKGSEHLERELRRARALAEKLPRGDEEAEEDFCSIASAVTALTRDEPAEVVARECVSAVEGWWSYPPQSAEELFQADLLREICGNPFRDATFEPARSSVQIVRIIAKSMRGQLVGQIA